MKTVKQHWKPLAIALVTACLASCADRPVLVSRQVAPSKLDLPLAKPSPRFVVTLDEAYMAVPPTKTGWEIYADSTNYYLLPIVGGPKIKTSASIRNYGYPISGVTRDDIDRIKQARPVMSAQQLARIVPNRAGKTTP